MPSAIMNLEVGSEFQAAKSRDEIPPPFSVITPLLEKINITKVHKDDEYSFYGSMGSDVMIVEAADFVSNNSDARKLDVRELLKNFLQLTSQDCRTKCKIQPDSGWFTVRMRKPTEEYVIPRWHRDGRMVDCTVTDHLLHCKYACTLLGASTMVLPETELVSKIDNKRSRRTENAEILSSEVPVTFEKGQIIRFSWGRKDSPVHSEPNITIDRIFMSVLYGSESEIRDMVEVRRCHGFDDFYRSLQ